MSSFIGHGLAALAIGKAFARNETLKSRWLWQACLLFCAYAPDIDYLIPALNKPNNGDIRITHTIAFCLLTTGLVMITLLLFDRKNIFLRGGQAFLAGFSHLVLDLLVGGRSGDAWLYPLYRGEFVLPFGILPSAGAMSLSNYYFYRNGLIEVGILLPVFVFILVALNRIKIKKVTSIVLFCLFTVFLVWSVSLRR